MAAAIGGRDAVPPPLSPQLWLMDRRTPGARGCWMRSCGLPRGAGRGVPPPSHSAPRRGARLYEQVRIVARGTRAHIGARRGRRGSRSHGGPTGAHGPRPRTAVRSAHACCGPRRHMMCANSRQPPARGADLIFLSPVFATRSHPGPHARWVRCASGLLARQARVPVVAPRGDDAPSRGRWLVKAGRLWLGGDRCVGAAARSGASSELEGGFRYRRACASRRSSAIGSKPVALEAIAHAAGQLEIGG